MSQRPPFFTFLEFDKGTTETQKQELIKRISLLNGIVKSKSGKDVLGELSSSQPYKTVEADLQSRLTGSLGIPVGRGEVLSTSRDQQVNSVKQTFGTLPQEEIDVLQNLVKSGELSVVSIQYDGRLNPQQEELRKGLVGQFLGIQEFDTLSQNPDLVPGLRIWAENAVQMEGGGAAKSPKLESLSSKLEEKGYSTEERQKIIQKATAQNKVDELSSLLENQQVSQETLTNFIQELLSSA